MTPEKLALLAKLQQALREFGVLPAEEQEQLDALRRELAMAPEVADDPSTLPDESSRPLLDGGNYNDTLKAMCRDEAINFAKLLAARVGVPLAEAALQAGIAALKR